MRRYTIHNDITPCSDDSEKIVDMPDIVQDERDNAEDGINPYPLAIGFAIFLMLLELPYRRVEIPGIALNGLGILSLGALILLSMEQLFLTLLLLVAYLPFSQMMAGDFGGFMIAFNLTNILTAIVVVGWVARGSMRKQKIYLSSTADLPILLFSILAVVSLIRGGMATDGLSWSVIVNLKRYLTPLFFFWFFSSNLRSLQQCRQVIIVAQIVVAITAFMALKEFYVDIGGGGSWDRLRIRGICEQSNDTCAFYVYYSWFPLAYLLLIEKNRRQWFHWGLFGVFLASFWAMSRTFSRGGVLSFLAAFMFLLFYRSRRLFLIFTTSALFVIFVTPQIIPGSLVGRFGKIKNTSGDAESMDKSAQDRLKHWRGAVRMMVTHPVIGVGYGLYYQNAAKFAGNLKTGARDVHQGFLLIGAEMGIPALVMFCVILVVFYRAGSFVYHQTDDLVFRAFGLSVMVMVVGVYACNHFGDRLNSQEMSSYYWIYGALALALKRLMTSGVIPMKDASMMTIDKMPLAERLDLRPPQRKTDARHLLSGSQEQDDVSE